MRASGKVYHYLYLRGRYVLIKVVKKKLSETM